MTFRNYLEKLNACRESLKWVKDKTIEEAWATCENSEWMLWILNKTDLDLIDPVCDIAERVLHLVPEDNRLACSNAINATRRLANIDELQAAYAAVYTDYYASRPDDSNDSSAYYAICCAATCASSCTSSGVSSCRNAYFYVVAGNANAAVANYYDENDKDYDNEERKNQCDILRKYFTITQVKEALGYSL